MFTSNKVNALQSQRGFKIMLVSIFLSPKGGRPKNIPQHLCSNHWQTQEIGKIERTRKFPNQSDLDVNSSPG